MGFTGTCAGESGLFADDPALRPHAAKRRKGVPRGRFVVFAVVTSHVALPTSDVAASP